MALYLLPSGVLVATNERSESTARKRSASLITITSKDAPKGLLSWEHEGHTYWSQMSSIISDKTHTSGTLKVKEPTGSQLTALHKLQKRRGSHKYKFQGIFQTSSQKVALYQESGGKYVAIPESAYRFIGKPKMLLSSKPRKTSMPGAFWVSKDPLDPLVLRSPYTQLELEKVATGTVKKYQPPPPKPRAILKKDLSSAPSDWPGYTLWVFRERVGGFGSRYQEDVVDHDTRIRSLEEGADMVDKLSRSVRWSDVDRYGTMHGQSGPFSQPSGPAVTWYWKANFNGPPGRNLLDDELLYLERRFIRRR